MMLKALARAPAKLIERFALLQDGSSDSLIVNLLDSKLFAPNPNYLSYTLSKQALAALTDLAARALAGNVALLRVRLRPRRSACFQTRSNSSGATVAPPLDDDSTLMLMARHVLGGPADDGRASYQIALAVCPACSQGFSKPRESRAQ